MSKKRVQFSVDMNALEDSNINGQPWRIPDNLNQIKFIPQNYTEKGVPMHKRPYR